ncbi:MAG TPA: AAA family ATPase [Candidatus Dormibacteraeota bacterium]|nr:AAA family ATPase [Candidatus Dormibacteraeota bacterium]
MRRGRILVLNGTSSSGKTTLASALQSASPEPYEVVGLDRWLKRVPPELFVVVDSADHPPVDGFLVPMREGIQIALPTLGPAAIEVLKEMYVSFAAGADRGTNLIVDDVLWHPAALALAISQFADRDAWLIGVLCPIPVAVAREQQRHDRARVGAAMFGELVHARTVYDTTVDTSVLTPEEAAARILDALQLNDRPRAFRKLRSGMTQ